MRTATQLIIAITAALLITGCPDKDKHRSIEANNKGVQAANNGRHATAIGHFKDATRMYPANHEAWYGLGHMQGKQKKWDDAAKSFEEAVKHKKDNAMYRLWLGVAQYENGNLESSQANLEEALKLKPELYRAHWYLGRVHRDEDRPREAAESWTRACQLNPLYGPPFVRLGELYLQWDKVDEAIRVLEQGTQYVKEDIDLTNVYYYLGLAYDEKEDWDKSIRAYTDAIDQRKQNVDALFQRGLAYAQKGNKTKAKVDLEAYSQSGDNAFNKTQANKVLLTLLVD